MVLALRSITTGAWERKREKHKANESIRSIWCRQGGCPSSRPSRSIVLLHETRGVMGGMDQARGDLANSSAPRRMRLPRVPGGGGRSRPAR
jgi:hypothetical protein